LEAGHHISAGVLHLLGTPMASEQDAPAGWHRNVYVAFLMQLLTGISFSVALGPLFDVYLFQIGDGNKTVGAVESVSGLVALGLVLPVGFLVDSWDRLLLMKIAALSGLLVSALGVWALMTDSIALWYGVMVVFGIYSELGGSVCYAIFADSVSPATRTQATSRIAIIANVASAVGPALSLVALLFLGNKWSLQELRTILMVGMVVVNPLACISMLIFQKAPFEGSDAAIEGEEQEADDAGPDVKRRWGAKAVPWLLAGSDLMTMIGAGMTVKYFNLYWKNDWHMTPAQVLAISVVQPLVIALFIRLLEKPAEWLGRPQASLTCFFTGVVTFIVLAKVKNLPIALTSYFIRCGMANATYPINKAIMYDFTPSSQRGRWNAVETLCGSIWSGSAFIGGFLADKYDYRFTFLVTAGIYAVASAAYSPLLCIVPRKAPGGSDAAVPMLRMAHSPKLSSIASPILQSPGQKNAWAQSPLSKVPPPQETDPVSIDMVTET